MDGKADVKSLMAKFSAAGDPTEEVSVGGRPFKVPGQNSPSGLQAKKNFFNNQGNASPPTGPGGGPKFGGPKPPVGAKPSPEEKPELEPKPPFLKPVGAGQRFGTPAPRDPEGKVAFLRPVGPKPNPPREDAKPVFPRPPGNKPLLHAANQDQDPKPPGPKPRLPPPAQESESKPVFSKFPGVQGKFVAASQDQEPKPLFPKPLGPKPSPSLDDPHEGDSPTKNASPFRGPSAPLGVKPKSGSLRPAREDPDAKGHGGETSSSPFPGVVLKPAASRGAPGLPRKPEDRREDRKLDAAKNVFLGKMSQEEPACGAPPALLPKTPSKGTVAGLWSPGQEKERGDKGLATPKQKPLPPLAVLGPPPPKPSRPPQVDLAKFRKAAPANSTSKGQTPYSTASLPPPPPPHPASQPPLPASHPTQPPVPSLPPRNIKPPLDLKSPVNEDNQDGAMHFDGAGNIDEEESDGETYEDIEASKEREKKREKEEKKRLEQEKKEQKEREKKEQEIKKKFKLTGPIEVIHQARACCDVKGGKNELSFKQGEPIEIIRITDNPEGKWLGRTTRGSYGYIKTTAVQIDYDSLQRKKNSLGPPSSRPAEDDQEVYDDVAEQDEASSHSQSGSGGMFPPPPDDDIYDGIEEEDADDGSTLQVEEKSNSWSWGILKILKGKDDRKKSIREKPKDSESDNNEGSSFPAPPKQLDLGEEVYDDVDASDYPSPSADMNQGAKARTEEKDLKKLKKQEKEEKDFRKKFKYDGEIRVLYSTTVVSSLTSKKWGNRELPVKPGESLEVIQNTDDTKVLCRNDEGKYGYVLRSNLVDNDGEIYDDIADGCIYDND
ncbi:FYN-binding protein 1 isoform X1 [Pipistrellus kuhlii]|uniref:FYN-binding protein 1 n=2 Tax=Pipistrellus kuhlii TaxID=59472 RepID=A0A7J7YWA9_PIPKU|nr:FYN-binding protein 1 isoform X1 [Pipistrellus kuhlii]KAF6366222.1 FYN binding protein 1 [Pipistrellus kuhlii]